MDHPVRLADQLRAHLRALRKQRGLTQAQLGQRLGIGQVRVAEIEARPGLVSTDQLIQLLSALGATLVLRDGGTAPASGPSPPSPARAKAAPKRATKAAGRAKTPARATPPVPPRKGSW
jgi:HTH-type transcriptional regulator/antitoxin HipB